MVIWNILGKRCHESVEVSESDPLLGIKEHVVVSNFFCIQRHGIEKKKRVLFGK